MNPRRPRCMVLWVCAAVAGAVSGCVLGPEALQISRVRYNQAIQATTSEQFLLNLVRLQYREAPLFLEVGSISAQFQFRASADVGGIINEGPNPINPDRLDLGAGVGYEERPTVTFTPLQGEDFVNRLLSPLQLDAVVLLSRSGWSIDRVLRLTVQTMNDLDNASGASGPTPEVAPHYDEFGRVSTLFRELQTKGLLKLGYETRITDLAGPLPGERVGVPEVVAAAERGYGLRPTDDGRGVVLTRSSSVLVWRIPWAAAEAEEVTEIIELLGLTPGQSHYEIHPAVGGQADPMAPGQRRDRIYVGARSLMGALFYLSQAVEVPEEHRRKGLVTTTLTIEGTPFDWSVVTGDLLRIHSCSRRPKDAAVAVRHRGYWYYIEDTDLSSKSTFGLLSQLFALQAGDVESVAPVLTLPVGG